ncbi:hypothetical protein [Geomonas anaerohicana]|uniref:Lipoprotein n=1 Tax=Geomonas anaerohicana TaxID=2798583 RepID=A0ABS0YF83_9BACT|nr:hypothetical protein [Geomonas anaerohicana]MBJ6750557.1 hypothetical protein [Geomonas anaerohicana]
MKLSLFRPLLRMLPLLLLFAVAGCGEIDWFPPYVKPATSPDAFSFDPPTTGTEKNVDVTSKEIDVKGLTAATSPIKVSGAAGSTYSINGGAATSSDGTVKNGDKVTVTHKSATTLGTATTSTLTIGDKGADFVSTTKTAELGKFTDPVQNGSFVISHADVTDAASGTQQVSIADSLKSTDAQFQVTSTLIENPDLTLFTNIKQGFALKGQRIFVRNLATQASATTTLTIDGVDTVVTLTPP